MSMECQPAPAHTPPVRFPSRSRSRIRARIACAAVALASLTAGLSACGDATAPDATVRLDLRSDTGKMNFAYALIQLEIDFYLRVTGNKFPGMLKTEATSFQSYLNATRSNRFWVGNYITSSRITDALLFKLGSAVNFSDRTSTLTAAQTILDAEARGLATVAPTIGSPVLADTMAAWAMQAKQRANAVRAMRGLDTLTVTPLAASEVLTTLAPYYLTTFSVTNP